MIILSLSRSKFARICVETDLSKPLKKGFWIRDDEHRVFVVVLYEKLPTFYYLYGMVGQGSNHCNRRSSGDLSRSSPPPLQVPGESNGMVAREAMDSLNNDMEAENDPLSQSARKYPK